MDQLAQRYTPDELRVCKEGTVKVENVAEFDPITFTFSENSNHGLESLLEV